MIGKGFLVEMVEFRFDIKSKLWGVVGRVV